MIVWTIPIYDRTQDDVDNDSSKGQINYDDLNRIEGNTQYLSDLLNQYGYSHKIITKSDWSINDIRYKETSKSRIVDNIEYLGKIYMLTGVELPDSMDNLEFKDANNIERNLYVINQTLEAMIYNLNNFNKCGTVYTGGSPII